VNQHAKFTITAVAAPWSEEERRRRLAAAYKILLDAVAKPERKAAGDTAGSATCTRCGGPVFPDGDRWACLHCDQVYGGVA
jgi:hypothetical protein